MIKNVETYHEGDLWKVKVQGNDRASGTYATKEQAQAAGREKAKSLRVEHIIKNKDGKIGARNSYGNDPNPPRG